MVHIFILNSWEETWVDWFVFPPSSRLLNKVCFMFVIFRKLVIEIQLKVDNIDIAARLLNLQVIDMWLLKIYYSSLPMEIVRDRKHVTKVWLNIQMYTMMI